MAEAWSVGALGVEERDETGVVVLIIYGVRASEAALTRVSLAERGVQLVSVEPIVDEDWSEAWKEGLGAIVISHRLVVRPSFVEFEAAAGQCELIVDPGQAFGTGGHASTRLVLEWIDALAGEDGNRLAGARVLDVGTGSGVLALAALGLGAERAVGFDLDGVAVREAAVVAADNGLADRSVLYTGGIEALGGPPFDLVLANLLRTEMLPIAEAIATAVAPAGRLVLSGLLERDGAEVATAFGAAGLAVVEQRTQLDPSGEHWIAPLLQREQ